MSPAISIIIVAAIAVFTSVTAPLLLMRRTEVMHRSDQLEQYRREDLVAQRAKEAADTLAAGQVTAARLVKEVADQAAEAARKLQAAQQETIARTNEVARLAKEDSDRQQAKLDQIDAQAKRIHTLVNSDMTAARQAELDQTRAMVAVLQRILQLAKDRHQVPDPADVEALRDAHARVVDLEAILADRLTQLRQVQADAVVSLITPDDTSPPPDD